jgi:hypothetical protein
MKYNTIKNSLTTVNTTEGNVSLTGDQMSAIIDVSEISVKTLTANSGTENYDKLVIDCDLGVRLHSGEMRYYFDSDVSSTAVVSGISFQYKNESFQDYTFLPVYTDSNYYSTKVSGTLFAPRYVRFTHDLELTAGFLTTLSGYVEGNVRGLELYNDDTYVDFGLDGTVEGDNISVAIGGEVDTRSVAIYNSGTNKSTAYISLDSTYTDLDKVMGASLTENGPWVYPLDEEFSIVRASEDDDYGVYGNTELKDGVISMAGYSDAYDNLAISNENSNYITKVFSNNDSTWNSIIVDRVLPLKGSLKVDSDDGVETIEVRSSNYKPKSYHICRELYSITVSTTDYLRYRDDWVETGETKTTSTVNLLSATYYTTWRNFFIVIDPITERWGGFAYHYASSVTAQWYLLNVSSSDSVSSKLMAQQSVTTTAMSFDWKDVKFDYEGGMWIYFYGVSYRDSDFVEETGYYLCYFDSGLTNKFKYFNTADFVGAIGVSYTTKYVWCTMPEANQLQQLNTDGTVLYNHYENTEDLGGLCVLYDGTVWYANGKDLYNLKENGVVDDTKILTDVADDKFSVIAPDGDGSEALWALENFYVSRVIISGANKGQKEFSVYVDYAAKLYPVKSGVWVWCADIDNPSDSYMRYISKANKRVDREYKLDYNSTPGVLEHTYEDPLYVSKMPLSIDQDWSNLEWNKVNTESYILPEDGYHQAKITLQRETPYQRYGDGVDLDSVFHIDDDFNQSGGDPNTIVWGNYRGGARVYIEDNELVMTNDPTGNLNSYINTKDRYVLTGNFDVQFDYVMGDGTDTGKNESIYLYAYATDDGVWGQYLRSYVFIATPITSTSYIYCAINGGQSTIALGTNYDRWTGKLRLKRTGDNVNAYVWDPQASSWKGSSRTGANALGNYFYLQILTARTGSDIYIDNFTVNAGTAYYYSDTPKVKGICVQKDIELKDIYPSTSKNVYLRSQVSSDMNVEGHYDTSLKVRWRTPVE